jgi:hypothetical protein
MKNTFLKHIKLTLALVLFLQVGKVSAQCGGTWSGGSQYSFSCISNGRYVAAGAPASPSGCPSIPVFTADQSATYTFTAPVSAFSINFNAFSSVGDCAKLELKINGIHYNLTSANLVANSCNPAGIAFVTTDANGYITGVSSSTAGSNGEATIVINGVNAKTITVSANDGNGSIFSTPFSCVGCSAGATAPTLSAATINNSSCASPYINLNSLVTSTTPAGTTLNWYADNTRTTAVADPTTVNASGTYYAFYYDATNDCYSPASAAVTATYTACPLNLAPTVCPAFSFDLATLTSTPPAGYTKTYHSGTPATAANKITNTVITASGTYYISSFIADQNCYGPTSRPIVVTITDCCTILPSPFVNQ